MQTAPSGFVATPHARPGSAADQPKSWEGTWSPRRGTLSAAVRRAYVYWGPQGAELNEMIRSNLSLVGTAFFAKFTLISEFAHQAW